MHRLPLALAAAAVAAAPLLAATPAAASTTTTDPAKAAAGWLTTQLVGGDHLESSYTYNGKTTTYADYGNTADAVLGMDAAGVAQDAAGRATSYLAAHVGDYAGTAPNYYPGSLAKLALVAEAQHLDPHAFGGVDLVKALQDEEAQTGANKGLYTDPDTANGYQSVVTQALALVALSRTGNAADKPSQAAGDWLVGQACGDGGFQTDVRDPSAGTCTSDVDSTAYAVQALVATGRDATKALGWLATHRNSDGGYGQPGSNANSTAVAVQALTAAGRDTSGPQGWLRAHQQGCSAPAAQRGAVRYKSTYDAATATRATVQAAQALAGKTLVTIDNAGAAAAAPTLYCAAAVTTPTATPTTAPVTTPTAAPASGTGAGTTTAELPRTGAPSHTGGLAGAGAALVVVGGALVGLGRRRRA